MPVAVDERKAPKRRPVHEGALGTAARLRAEFGVKLSEQACEPLPCSAYDELSGEDGCLSTALTDLETVP